MPESRHLVLATVIGIPDTHVAYPYCLCCYSKLFKDQHQDSWYCGKCGQSCTSDQVEWRYRLALTITDGEVISCVCLFGKMLDQFFGKPATQFKRYLHQLESTCEDVDSLLRLSVEQAFIGQCYYFGFKTFANIKKLGPKNSAKLQEIVEASGHNNISSHENFHIVAFQILPATNSSSLTVFDLLQFNTYRNKKHSEKAFTSTFPTEQFPLKEINVLQTSQGKYSKNNVKNDTDCSGLSDSCYNNRGTSCTSLALSSFGQETALLSCDTSEVEINSELSDCQNSSKPGLETNVGVVNLKVFSQKTKDLGLKQKELKSQNVSAVTKSTCVNLDKSKKNRLDSSGYESFSNTSSKLSKDSELSKNIWKDSSNDRSWNKENVRYDGKIKECTNVTVRRKCTTDNVVTNTEERISPVSDDEEDPFSGSFNNSLLLLAYNDTSIGKSDSSSSKVDVNNHIVKSVDANVEIPQAPELQTSLLESSHRRVVEIPPGTSQSVKNLEPIFPLILPTENDERSAKIKERFKEFTSCRTSKHDNLLKTSNHIGSRSVADRDISNEASVIVSKDKCTEPDDKTCTVYPGSEDLWGYLNDDTQSAGVSLQWSKGGNIQGTVSDIVDEDSDRGDNVDEDSDETLDDDCFDPEFLGLVGTQEHKDITSDTRFLSKEELKSKIDDHNAIQSTELSKVLVCNGKEEEYFYDNGKTLEDYRQRSKCGSKSNNKHRNTGILNHSTTSASIASWYNINSNQSDIGAGTMGIIDADDNSLDYELISSEDQMSEKNSDMSKSELEENSGYSAKPSTSYHAVSKMTLSSNSELGVHRKCQHTFDRGTEAVFGLKELPLEMVTMPDSEELCIYLDSTFADITNDTDFHATTSRHLPLNVNESSKGVVNDCGILGEDQKMVCSDLVKLQTEHNDIASTCTDKAVCTGTRHFKDDRLSSGKKYLKLDNNVKVQKKTSFHDGQKMQDLEYKCAHKLTDQYKIEDYDNVFDSSFEENASQIHDDKIQQESATKSSVNNSDIVNQSGNNNVDMDMDRGDPSLPLDRPDLSRGDFSDTSRQMSDSKTQNKNDHLSQSQESNISNTADYISFNASTDLFSCSGTANVPPCDETCSPSGHGITEGCHGQSQIEETIESTSDGKDSDEVDVEDRKTVKFARRLSCFKSIKLIDIKMKLRKNSELPHNPHVTPLLPKSCLKPHKVGSPIIPVCIKRTPKSPELVKALYQKERLESQDLFSCPVVSEVSHEENSVFPSQIAGTQELFTPSPVHMMDSMSSDFVPRSTSCKRKVKRFAFPWMKKVPHCPTLMSTPVDRTDPAVTPDNNQLSPFRSNTHAQSSVSIFMDSFDDLHVVGSLDDESWESQEHKLKDANLKWSNTNTTGSLYTKHNCSETTVSDENSVTKREIKMNDFSPDLFSHSGTFSLDTSEPRSLQKSFLNTNTNIPVKKLFSEDNHLL